MIRIGTVTSLAFSLGLLGTLPSAAVQTTAGPQPEVVSLLGTKFYAQPDEKGVVAAAIEKLRADPKNIDNILALGKAQADVWRYHDAIETYSRGIELFSENAMLYRHRGHRFISTRQFGKAVEDLEKAARLNEENFDIWYHLGLAYYLQGDFGRAARAYESCYKVVNDPARGEKSQSDDSLVAISDWLYMTYRRARRDADAAKILERITSQMNVKENTSYYHRLLFYKGLKKEEELLNLEKATDLEIATLGYGVSNWHLYSGHKTKAKELFQRIVSGKYWPAFGFIASEVELARAAQWAVGNKWQVEYRTPLRTANCSLRTARFPLPTEEVADPVIMSFTGRMSSLAGLQAVPAVRIEHQFERLSSAVEALFSPETSHECQPFRMVLCGRVSRPVPGHPSVRD